MELFLDTTMLRAGRTTPVCTQDKRPVYLLRRSFNYPLSFQLLNTDARLLGSIRNSLDSLNRYDLTLGGHPLGTLIRMAGTTNRGLYMMTGTNWIITGTTTTNSYHGFHGFEAVFGCNMVPGGSTMSIWSNKPDDDATCILLAAGLDQIRSATVIKQQPLGYSF